MKWQPGLSSKVNNKGYAREYIVIAERVLGKPLPSGAVVHHADGNSKVIMHLTKAE